MLSPWKDCRELNWHQLNRPLDSHVAIQHFNSITQDHFIRKSLHTKLYQYVHKPRSAFLIGCRLSHTSEKGPLGSVRKNTIILTSNDNKPQLSQS